MAPKTWRAAPKAKRNVHWVRGAAPGADFDDDDVVAAQWVQWRVSHPIRASGGVVRTGQKRPTKQEQQERRVYTALNDRERVHQ